MSDDEEHSESEFYYPDELEYGEASVWDFPITTLC